MSHLGKISEVRVPSPVARTEVAALPLAKSVSTPVDAFVGSVGAGAEVSAVSNTFKAGPPDGKAFVAAALEDIRQRVANGEEVRVVFDIDDTLSDSRGRTLHILQEYDRNNGTSHFKDLKLEDVAWDGYSTVVENGGPKELAKSVGGFWRAKFFDGAMHEHDLPLKEMVDLAKAAKAAGAEVRYLTGRPEEEREHTLPQLIRFGLPDADNTHLTMKPTSKEDTGKYKAAVFTEWEKDSAHTAFFITESRRDVAAVQGATPNVPCVLIDAAKERDNGHQVDPQTPVYPSLTNLFGRPSPWEVDLGWMAA